MKKIAAIIGAFALVLAGAGTASAAWTVNDDSTLEVLRERFVRLTTTNRNSATISNRVFATSNTGGNVINAEEDVEDGSITSGDAEAATQIENVANDIDSEIDVADGTNGDLDEDIDVDDDSDVDVTDTLDDRMETENINEVAVDNETAATANTGGNVVNSENDDVEGGSIESGNATTASAVANAFNILRQRITRN